ncbi:hypothetical protein ACRE_076960 [Hapsidospora chrysogenum ATCC 11550]|uniref:Uncharacterized protein n=1 Tax=Hapsidospora chrysogenum (strain ATCC 11550 / CBS 779.69 / DSM 880 / IAM 14645 / JCM 23072 / IMI 49137) TaxID=857340 RepID=A0A086SWV5_HAPC1|nr:hypothetical protein ACRE_076960 [Hapsidospora chrysogenum ATCC 11550]
MSASKNPDAMNSAQGEFSSRVPPGEPMTTKGHAPGVHVGNDAAPEFHAETHTPGTAPTDRSFQPNPSSEFNAQAEGRQPAASETLPGATSADVHQGLGHPGQGQTSQEMHGAHAGKRKKERSGLEGVGASYEDPIHKEHADRPYETGVHGKATTDYPAAEDRPGATAEDIASERR